MPSFSLVPTSRSVTPLGDVVPAATRIRRRFTLSSGPSSNASVSFLQELLRHHQLPQPVQLNAFDSSVYEDQDHEYIRPATVTMPSSPSLLDEMHRCLCRYAKLLVPNATLDQPWTEDTLRLSKLFRSLSEKAASSSGTTDHAAVEPSPGRYLSEYLLRPLNELIASMLLPQGILLHWQAQEDSDTCHFELVWTMGGCSPRQVRLALMEALAPFTVTSQDLQSLAMAVRLGTMYVYSNGRLMQMCSPDQAQASERTTATKVAGRFLAHMQDAEVPVAILTNCNQFLMLHAAMDSGKSSIEFSEPISGGEPSKGQLSASHLGFLLGATMLAFRRHTEKMSTTELAAYTKLPTTLLLETLACDKFGAVLGTRSNELRLRRRGMSTPEVYPSRLGTSVFSFFCSQSVLHELGVYSPIWTRPFFGPYEPFTLPCLLEERTDDNPWWVPQIELISVKGSGTLWTAFSAKLRTISADRTDTDLVIKFFVPSMFPMTRISKHTVYTRDEAKAAAMHELATYKGPLADLQGRLVPQLRGIFGSCQSDGVQVWCVMLDDAGDEIKPSERRSIWVQKSVRKAYADLHAAGVLHGDVNWSHIRRLGMSKNLQLIDFDRAKLRSPGMTEYDWDTLTRGEMECVETLLESTIPCSPVKQESTLRRNPSTRRRKPVPSFEPLSCN